MESGFRVISSCEVKTRDDTIKEDMRLFEWGGQTGKNAHPPHVKTRRGFGRASDDSARPHLPTKDVTDTLV